MEGRERRAVEARIAHLRNIQVLLDCATVQLQQYTSVLGALAQSPEFQATTMQPTPTTQSTPTTAQSDDADQIRQRRLDYLNRQAGAAAANGNE